MKRSVCALNQELLFPLFPAEVEGVVGADGACRSLAEIGKEAKGAEFVSTLYTICCTVGGGGETRVDGNVDDWVVGGLDVDSLLDGLREKTWHDHFVGSRYSNWF